MLAIARTSAFWNRKVVIVSSPGIKGISHVEREIAESTCEYWNLPCPDCGVMQVLEWDRINLDDYTHGCIACEERFAKYEWLLGKGEWIATRPTDEKGNKVLVRGFVLSGLYNPWIEWEELKLEYVRAMAAYEAGDVELLKAFRNTRLGQLHEDIGESVDIDLYGTRREDYIADVPDGVLVLTAGIDVQERFLAYEVVGWGKGAESWGIEYGLLDGDPREVEVWEALDEAVYQRTFTTSDGKKMRVKRLAVDSGYAPDYVYSYTKPRQPRAISIKGDGGLGKPLVRGAGTLTKIIRARLMHVGVDSGKEEIVNRLRVRKRGPGFCHFPRLKNGEPARGYDEEYFKGLTAEKRVVKTKHGFRTYIWTKLLSQRNEPFDCRNYALVASRLPFSGINLETMARDTYEPPKKTKPVFGAQKASVEAKPPWEQRQQSTQQFGATNRPVQ